VEVASKHITHSSAITVDGEFTREGGGGTKDDDTKGCVRHESGDDAKGGIIHEGGDSDCNSVGLFCDVGGVEYEFEDEAVVRVEDDAGYDIICNTFKGGGDETN
jgi:hypothetical protein